MGRHEGAVRAAMDRLFAGQAVHTDGRLTVKDLAVEAAIPRSTLTAPNPSSSASSSAASNTPRTPRLRPVASQRRSSASRQSSPPRNAAQPPTARNSNRNVAAVAASPTKSRCSTRNGGSSKTNSRRTERLSPWTPTAGKPKARGDLDGMTPHELAWLRAVGQLAWLPRD
jgi:hypothetical protein